MSTVIGPIPRFVFKNLSFLKKQNSFYRQNISEHEEYSRNLKLNEEIMQELYDEFIHKKKEEDIQVIAA